MNTRGTALQTIFSFFLGLMVTAFVGVGVYTFHPPPQREIEAQITTIERQEQAQRLATRPDSMTAADRAEQQRLADERAALTDSARAAREAWGRSTSIVLIIFATLVMAISLVRADQLPVLSNGLLLGGLFTMVYGVGWIVATDTSFARFFVMLAALGITLGLGYARFVRSSASPKADAEGATHSADVSELVRRLSELEDRVSEAARLLSRRD